MNAFYPGAGTDLAPPVLFPEIKTWYYMDSQPRSEYGDTVILYRPTFLDQLNQIMRQCGFERLAVTNNLYTYFSPLPNKPFTTKPIRTFLMHGILSNIPRSPLFSAATIWNLSHRFSFHPIL